jgi:hypothetical protein
MNSIVTQHMDILHATQALREQIFDLLTDDDLAYTLPGDNPSLGALWREAGEIQQSYIECFREFKTDWSYRHPDPTVANSVERLRVWFRQLDADIEAALRALSEEDLSRTVERGYGFTPPVSVNFHVFREALLIFYAKASVYLKALRKPFPQQLQGWIG